MSTFLSGLARDEDAAFRRQFERDAIWSRLARPGDRVPDLPLVEVDLGPIHLDRMRRTGPLVLVFFRYAKSPVCLAALRRYQDELAPALTDLDAHLIAVSPQVPDRLRAVKRRLGLDFFVASDPRHRLIDALNMASTPRARTRSSAPGTRSCRCRPRWSSTGPAMRRSSTCRPTRPSAPPPRTSSKRSVL